MLLDAEGMPEYWPTLFVSTALRPKVTASTIENTLRSVVHLKLWELSEGRDLIGEISEGRFPVDEDIISIRDHCWLSASSVAKLMEIKSNARTTKLSAMFPSSPKAFDPISKAHFANRIAHISHYLHFTSRALLRRRADFASLKLKIEEMKRALIATKLKIVKKSASANDPDFRAPPPEAFNTVMRIATVDSPDNPFKDPGVRSRNALMFDIMYETGIRAGELLSLRVSDVAVKPVGSSITVTRRHDDIFDPRSKQPVAKTLERELKINQELAYRIRDYIMNVRAYVNNANRHPFLFVTHKNGKFCGRPISDTTFRNRILERVIQVAPDLLDEICRHGFRHNFNYRLSKIIDAHNAAAELDPKIPRISAKEELQIRKYLNGWSSDGSAEVYNKRHIKELADSVMLEDMKSQAKNLKKEDKK